MRKISDYRDKSIEKIVAMRVEKPMNPSTINKLLGRASSLFNWAVKNGLMAKNPIGGMRLPTKKRADEYRDPFTSEDLRRLFHSSEYLNDTHAKSYGFWTPIIALFTGMREDEICQLSLSDIHKTDDDVYVFDVNNDGDKKVKTRSSRRIVPIHDFLLNDLGFIRYVEKLKERGEKRLFPELHKRRDGYGQTVSKWFARYKERCKVTPGKGKKDFHSFRHTFTDGLKQTAVEQQTLLSEVLGHEVSSITFSRYGKRYNAKLLKKKIVDKISYDIDLGHLKNSRFVI